MKITLKNCGGQTIELTAAEARDVLDQLRALLDSQKVQDAPLPVWGTRPLLEPLWIAPVYPAVPPVYVGDIVPNPYTITSISGCLNGNAETKQ
jgi:hypothetical protein